MRGLFGSKNCLLSRIPWDLRPLIAAQAKELECMLAAPISKEEVLAISWDFSISRISGACCDIEFIHIDSESKARTYQVVMQREKKRMTMRTEEPTSLGKIFSLVGRLDAHACPDIILADLRTFYELMKSRLSQTSTNPIDVAKRRTLKFLLNTVAEIPYKETLCAYLSACAHTSETSRDRKKLVSQLLQAIAMWN